jgi:hypothetical protein
VTDFAFRGTILFMGIRTRNAVDDACGFEIGIKAVKFTTPIRVKSPYFVIKLALYHCLKLKENRINVTLVFQTINPCIAGIIINKKNKEFMA